MHKLPKLLASLLIVALAGCVSTGIEVKPEQLAGFKKGVTTESDVVSRLGNPNGRLIDSEGTTIYTYTYVHAEPRASSFIPIVGPLVGGADSEVTTTTFRFGADRKLLSFTSQQSQYGTGTGFAAGSTQGAADQPRQASQ